MNLRSIRVVLAVASLLPAITAVAAPPSVPAQDAAVRAVVDGVSRERLEATVRHLASFPTRHTLSGAKGADAAANWLESEFRAIATASGGRLQVEKQTWTQPAGTRMPEPATISNVIATLPGTSDPERVIVISGHYDSRVTDVMNTTGTAPGANDDASGVAVVLELARAMALSPQRWGATVIFAAVTGEEQGLYGSAHLAETLKDAKRNVIAMLDNDIVGNSRGEDGKRDDKRIRVFSAGYDPGVAASDLARQRSAGTDADTPARTLARAVVDATRRYIRGFSVEMVYRNDRYGRGGDHTPFLQNGYPYAVRLTEPNEDWRHQHQDLRTEGGVIYGDLPEYVDYAYLRHTTQVNAALIADLAVAPPAPTGVGIVGDLSSRTTLRWNPAAPGDSVVAYEVLIRRTTAPDWQTTIRVPVSPDSATKGGTLPFSKDDYLFAVRAVGQTGARSLPTVPVAARP